MSSFGFEFAYFLWLIPLVILCSLKCKLKESALIFPHLNFLKSENKGFLIDFLKYSSIFLLIISMAGPVKKKIVKKSTNFDIAIVIDTKRGFESIKNATKDFIEKRVNDKIALVVFDRTVSPLTYDKDSLKKMLDFIKIDMFKNSKNFNGINLGETLLKRGDGDFKILILFADKKMIKRLNTLSSNIKIYLVSNKKKTIKASLRDILRKINNLEKSKIYILKDELYIYPLFIGVLMLLIYIYIYSRRGV